MKKWLVLLAGALFAGAALAADITGAQARTVAGNFVAKDAVGMRVLAGRTVGTVAKRGGFYLVTLKPTGHILVSVNRSAQPIPVFSESDFIEPVVGSPQAAFLAAAETNAINATGSQYEVQWKTLLGQKVLRLSTSSATEYVNIDPIVETSWTQNYPYNDLMPIINRSTTLVGCVATAYSQILRYWQWPEVLNEDIVTEHSVDSMWGHKWRLKAGTVFDWGSMPYSGGYDYSTRLKLGRGTMFAGMLARMSYNTAASGAQTARPGQNHWFTPYACLDTSNSTLEQREAGMKQSLKNECPFMVSVNYGTIGHAVVGDGWQESASGKYVHLNYGWGFSNSYYATTEPLGVYLDAKPRPMVMNRPLPTSSALPINVEWSFPTKGYEKTLERFDITYAEVSKTVGEWSDNMENQTGEFEGSSILIDEIGNRGDGNVLRIRPDADRAYYTWPTVVATADTVFSYKVRSQDARNIFVEVQLFDQATGWFTASTPTVSDSGVLDWATESVSLKDYAGKGVAVRVMVTSTGSHYSDVNDKAVGVQLDDITFTNVRQALAVAAGTVQAEAGARSASVDTAALSEGTMYLFQVTPVFNDGTAGIANRPAACTVSASGNAKPTIASVSSVRTSAPAVQSGMYRECYFGLNQFGVYGSEATTKLEAHLSNLVVIGEVEEQDTTQPAGTMITTHNKVSIENAVSVERKSPGNFLVKVNVSQLTDYLNGAGMILTLVARNDRGDAAQKDVFLKFTKTGSEEPMSVADLPAAGTISGGGTTPSEPAKVNCSVSFAAMGGTTVSQMTVEKDKAIGTLPTTSRDGYTFLGWFTDIGGGTKVTEATVITGNVIFFAQWKENTPAVTTYTVTFDPNGGSPEMSRFVNENASVGTLPTTVTKSGCKLVGWFTAKTGGTQISAAQVITGNITYYAHWEVSSGGGDTPGGGADDDGSTRFCHGVNKTSGAYDVTRSGTWNSVIPVGYNLIFWWVDRYYEANGENPGDYVAPNPSSLPSSDGTYTIQSYTASLLNSALATTLSAGVKREPYFPTATYSVNDWNGTASGNDRAIAAGKQIYAYLACGPIGVKVNTSLNRSYGAVIWGCDYAADGNDKYATAVYITETTSSTRSDNSVTKREIQVLSTADGNFTNVGLKDFNGSGNHGVIDYYYPITEPAGSGGGDDEPTTKTFIVTFDSDGGSTVNAQSVEDGKTLASIPQPTKSGYTFGGWFDGDTQLTTATKITANVTYTARWAKIVIPPVDPDEPDEPDTPDVPGDDPVIAGQPAGGNAVDTGAIDEHYGYRLVYNYWLARKLALLEKKKLFILSGATWCSYCTHTKEYLQGLGKDFTDKFVVYYVDRDNLVNSPYFKGGLPQYGSADPRTVNPFAGIYGDGTSGTPDWVKAWYAADNGLYFGNRGGFSQEQVSLAISSANNGDPVAAFDRFEIRGPSSVMSGKANTYKLYAIFTDGSEMLVDHGVTWSLRSGAGTMTVSTNDGDASTKLAVTSDQAVLRADSTYYFNGSADFTISSTQESKIKALAIVTDSLNLEDSRSPVLEATATLDDDTVVAISGVGTWTINSHAKVPRSDAELESNQAPSVTVDEFGKLTYSQGYQFEVYDHTLNVTLAANGISVTKDIHVWGPTKVAPASWTLASKTPRMTRYGVVRLRCTQLKYNYGGEIRTTSDTYYGNFRTVMQFGGGSSEYSYLRGLAFMSSKTTSGTWTLGLQSQRVNGQYQYWTPENFANYHSETIVNVAEGNTVADAAHGLVTEGFFNAYWPGHADYATLLNEDSDGDGFLNWQEYILGTDPTDATDALYLTQGYQHLTAPANDLEAFQYKIMFAQRPGRYYYLYAKESWSDNWTRVAKINYSGMDANQGMQIEVLNENKANNGKFFRVGAVLADHEFNALSTAEVIPNLLVAAPGSTIDLANETLPMNLISFDTDATHAGTVNVMVPESSRTPGTPLISAPKSAKTSLQACQPKDSGDVAFEVVDDPDDNTRMILKVKGTAPIEYKAPFMFFITENTNWSDIEWTDANGNKAKWSELGDAANGAAVVLSASAPFVVTVDTAVSVSTVTAGANVTLKFDNEWPTGFGTAFAHSAWQGTLLVANKTDCTGGNGGCTFAGLGNANSTVAFDGVSGWFDGFGANGTDRKGTEYGYALRIDAGGLAINNGSSDKAATFARLTGGGALLVGKSGNPTMRLVALDASGFTGTMSVVGNAGIIVGNPTDNAANGEVRVEGAALASAGYKIGGSGVVRLADANASESRNLSACVASVVLADGFTGTLALGKGRYVYTANCLPSNVKILVEDGGQLFVSDGVTMANAVTISGNGWGGETNLDVSKAAIRLGNNAVLSGALTVAGDAKIGVHTGNSASLNGAVSGSGNLTKWAGGTLLVGSVGTGLGGRFTVGQGTVKANTGSANFFGCSTDAKAIIVESGATFDMNGKHSADLTIELNGGKLTNTADGIASSKKTIRKIILTADSRLEGSNNYGLIANNYNEAFLELNGHTLTFEMSASNKDFWMPNATVNDGTIVIKRGRLYPWHGGNSKTSRYNCTIRVEGGEFKVQGDSTVDTLVLAGGSVTDSATLMINGTLDVAASSTVNRAFTLGDEAKVNLPLGKALTVNAAQRIGTAKFVVPDGYVAKETAGTGTYSYLAKLMQVDFTPNAVDAAVIADGDAKTGKLKIDHKWLREKTAAQKWTGTHKPVKPIEVASTPADIAEVLNSTGENGAKVWESYVLGLDPAIAESKPVVIPVQTSNPDAITLKVGNVEVNEDAGANNVTYTVVYSDKPIDAAVDGVTESTAVSIGESIDLPLPTSGVRYYSMKVQVD